MLKLWIVKKGAHMKFSGWINAVGIIVGGWAASKIWGYPGFFLFIGSVIVMGNHLDEIRGLLHEIKDRVDTNT